MRFNTLRRSALAAALFLCAPAALAQAPAALAPSGVTTALELALRWSPVPAATSYRVQLSTGRTFHADSLVALPGSGVTAGDSLALRAHSVRLANATRYFWRVRATGQPWSTTATFTTVVAAAAPGADYPSAGLELIGTTPEFVWNLGTGGTGFFVHMQVREASAPSDWSQTVVDIAGFDVLRHRPETGVLRDSAAYVWRVRALVPSSSAYYGVGTNFFAGFRTVGASLEVPFTTRPALVNPVANWPSGTDIVPQPPFTWFVEKPGGTMTYDIELVNRTAGGAFTGTPTVSGLVARTYTPATPLLEGTRYRWRVRSCTDAGARCTAWSAALDFTVRPPAPAVTPVASWPLGGATVYGAPVSLTWNAPGAPSGQRYIVYTRACTVLSCSDAPAIGAANTGYTPTAPTTSTSLALAVLPATGYAWYVRTADAAGTPGAASRLAKFRTFAPPAAVAVPTWPVGNPLVYTNLPTLSWTVENAHSGGFEIRYGASNNPNAVGLTSATAPAGATSFAVPAALAWGTRTYWHVRPAGAAVWRSASFTTVGAPGTLRPVHTVPSDSAIIAGPTATLTWYLDGHTAAVARYEVQVSTRSTFSASRTTTATVDAPAQSLTTAALLPGTTYFWRVRAFNGTAWTAWTIGWRFTTAADDAAIVPFAASPADYAEADAAPMLSWALPTPSAAPLAFDIEVATDEAMTNPERLSLGAGDEAGGVAIARRAPGTYHWRVRSRTASGDVSEFSEIASFIVYGSGAVTDADAPVLAADRVRLDAPQPNPMRGAGSIRFALPTAAEATLEVLDLTGRRVRTLATGTRAAGVHTLSFDGLTDGGAPLATGVYVLRLRAGGASETHPLVVVR